MLSCEQECCLSEGVLDWADKLFNPASVALIGASEDPHKVGGTVFRNLCASHARLYPVNPKLASLHGHTCYPSITQVPEVPDLAMVAVPTGAVASVVEECVVKGVRLIVVVSAGFGETGEKGKLAERRLVELARKSGARILGPNTMGVLRPAISLDTTFVPGERWHRPPPGPIALVCQSGALGVDGAEAAWLYGGGISVFVTLGNKCDLNECDMVEALAVDHATRCIAMYLEGFADGRRFIEICRLVTPHKPIVVLKGGRSDAGARAAALHTGSLAGSDRVVDGAFKQAGILRAYDVSELMDYAHALAFGPPLCRPRLGVLTCAGGFGVILADYLADPERPVGASLAEFGSETERRLRQVALSFASVRNPIDLTGSATNQMFDQALEILQDDPNVDAILVSLIPYPPLLDEGIVEVLDKWRRQGRKPLVAIVQGQVFLPHVLQRFWRAGVLAYPGLAQAVRAVGALCQRGEYLMRIGGE